LFFHLLIIIQVWQIYNLQAHDGALWRLCTVFGQVGGRFPSTKKKAHQSVRFKYCFTFPVVWVRRCRLVAADSDDSTTSVKRVSPQYIPGINTVFIDYSPTNLVANSVFQPCYQGV